MMRAHLLALFLVLPAGSAAEEPGKLPLSTETLWGIKRLGAPRCPRTAAGPPSR